MVITAQTEDGEVRDLASLSGGEKSFCQMCLFFALWRVRNLQFVHFFSRSATLVFCGLPAFLHLHLKEILAFFGDFLLPIMNNFKITDSVL
jgi:hypothetical protein